MVLFRKFLAWFIALVQVFLVNIGIMRPNGLISSVDQIRNEISEVNMMNKGDSELISSVEYAQGIKNVVQCAYTDSGRNAYKIENGQVSFVHTLTDVEKSATLSDRDGGVYLKDTFRSFYTDKLGVKHYFEKTTADGRINTIRLGAYYYECHLRDFVSANYLVDKGFHVYADKLYMEYALLSKFATKAFNDFGSEIAIPKSAVCAVEYADKNGVGSDFKKMDASTVEYVAFDIKDVGVVGFIIPTDGTTKSVEVKEKSGSFVVTQLAGYDGSGLNKYDETGDYKLNKISFGCRIYTDKTHSFDGIALENYKEKNPLGITVLGGNSAPAYLGYETLRGTYTVHMKGMGFVKAYNNPDLKYDVKIKVEGDSTDRSIYIRTTATDTGGLESAALLDRNSNLVAIDVEVCKNFMGDGGEPLYSVKDYCYSDTFTPLMVEKDSEKEFTVLNLYQNWGKYPLKQISSIEFHVSYYHLSTGTTESNCIAPYFVYGKDGWLLPDFRGRSGIMWSGQPQFNSVGTLKFMSYRDKSVKNTIYSEFSGSEINSSGPAYADVINYFTDDGGKYTYSLRHVEFPQTDENRTYYTLKVDFKEDMTVENFKRDFDIFYFDGRYVAFNKMGYINENGEHISANVSEKTTYHTLGSEAPFFGFYNMTDATIPDAEKYSVGADFGLIIKDSNIIINGHKADIPFVFKESGNEKLTQGVLTLDAEKVEFRKGDSIEIDMILLPYGTGLEDSDENAVRVREDSALKPVKVSAEVGTVIKDTYLPLVRAENNEAVFTVSGGRGNIAVRADGFASMLKPEIFILSDGEWKPYEVASVSGFDGYTVHANSDGTYSFSFVYTSADPDASYTFKVVQ